MRGDAQEALQACAQRVGSEQGKRKKRNDKKSPSIYFGCLAAKNWLPGIESPVRLRPAGAPVSLLKGRFKPVLNVESGKPKPCELPGTAPAPEMPPRIPGMEPAMAATASLC